MECFFENRKLFSPMKTYIFYLFLCCLWLKNTTSHAVEINFNEGWSFQKSEISDFHAVFSTGIKWNAIALPHLFCEGEADSCCGLNTPMYGWYLKRFSKPQYKSDERVILVFNGITHQSFFWVNGFYLATSNASETGFELDVTDALNSSENTIVVRTSFSNTKVQRTVTAGIYGSVLLNIKNNIRIVKHGVVIATPSLSPSEASVEVRTQINNASFQKTELHLLHTLYDPDGTIKGQRSEIIEPAFMLDNGVKTKAFKIFNPIRWNVETPQLYAVKTELIQNGVVLDSVINYVGLRDLKVDANKGFLLNGEEVKLKGVDASFFKDETNVHWPESFYRDAFWKLKAMGCNFLHVSNPFIPESFYQLCDSFGMLVAFDPFFSRMDNRAFVLSDISYLKEYAKARMQAISNHPSVVMWNVTSSLPIYNNKQDIATSEFVLNQRQQAADCISFIKQYDSSRPVSLLVNRFDIMNDTLHFMEMCDFVVCNLANLQNNKLGKNDSAELKQNRVQLGIIRQQFPNKAILFLPGLTDYHKFPNSLSKEENLLLTQQIWHDVYASNYFMGGIVPDLSRMQQNTVLSKSGDESIFISHELSDFYKSIWSDKPILRIISTWNAPKHKKQVVVVSNCENVRLSINGNELNSSPNTLGSYSQWKQTVLEWDGVEWEKGTLAATGTFNGEVYSHEVKTHLQPVNVKLVEQSQFIDEHGHAVIIVQAVLVDKKGNLCLSSNLNLSVKLEGAELLNCRNSFVVFADGNARIVLSATTKNGSVVAKFKDGTSSMDSFTIQIK